MAVTRTTKNDEVLDLLKEVIRQNSERERSQAELMKAVLQTVAAQAASMQSLFDLWKPPSRENRADALDHRMLKQEEDAAADWEPIPSNVFEQLDRDLGIPAEFLRDDA